MPYFKKKHREDRKPPKYAGEVPAHSTQIYQSISKIEPLSAGKRKQEEREREISFELNYYCRSEKEAHPHKKRENNERGARQPEQKKKRKSGVLNRIASISFVSKREKERERKREKVRVREHLYNATNQNKGE